ncbi:MAG TPA: molybdenum cofactor guanylyltransferase [Marinagarivorans sp.]
MHTTHHSRIDLSSVTGLILAGGKSTRMAGQNKAQKLLGGKTLLAHSCDILASSVSPLLISSGRHDYTLASEAPYITLADRAELGPLEGILAGLTWVKNNTPHRWLAVMPCDAPFTPTNWLTLLCAERPCWSPMDTDATIALAPRYVRCHDTDHYAHALWPVDAIPAVAHALKTHRLAIRQVLKAIQAKAIDISSHCEPESFLNINKLEDLVKAEHNLACKSLKKQPK